MKSVFALTLFAENQISLYNKTIVHCFKNNSEVYKGMPLMNEKNSGTFTLINDKTGDKYTLPIISGTTGPDVIDVRRLYSETDHFTFDPGYTSTGSCESSLTYIDGDRGILLHRGYPIEELAEQSNFLELAHLLLFGELPNQKESEKFVHDITYHTMLHEQLMNFYRGFRRDAHPMAIMCGVVGALSAFYHDSTDFSDINQRMIEMTLKLFSKAGRPKPKIYDNGPEDYRNMITKESLDAVNIATPWEWHHPMAILAMKNKMHVGVEVPAALTIKDCWDLVDTSEKTKKLCMIMENVNYRRDIMAVLNMVRQGIFGELIHCQGGYQHDLRHVKFNDGNGPYGLSLIHI